MGFNNHGAVHAAKRLTGPRSLPVGVNIGKTKLVDAEQAASDYVFSAEQLGGLADYFVVNVSSPNTPGLRNLQAVEKLGPLLSAVRAALDRASPARHVPLLVKIAPDLPDEEIDAVARSRPRARPRRHRHLQHHALARRPRDAARQGRRDRRRRTLGATAQAALARDPEAAAGLASGRSSR